MKLQVWTFRTFPIPTNVFYFLSSRSVVPGEHRSNIPSCTGSSGGAQGWTVNMWQLWRDHGIPQECGANSGQEDTRQSYETGMNEVTLGCWTHWLAVQCSSNKTVQNLCMYRQRNCCRIVSVWECSKCTPTWDISYQFNYRCSFSLSPIMLPDNHLLITFFI